MSMTAAESDFASLPVSSSRRSGTSWAFIALILVWASVQIMIARPESIAQDWNGWRQTDTQSIARNFNRGSLNVFYPQVNWGGSGPGYVESELQLYPWMIAATMRLTGDAEWPGQVFSIIFAVVAAWVIYRVLLQRFGELPAISAVAIMLAGHGMTFLSTCVMPEMLCFLAYSVSIAFFLNYLETARPRTLLLSALATTLAGLVKPPALQLGIFQFLIVLAVRRDLLRSILLWISWTFIVLVVGAYLLHAQSLYQIYGNTFGVLSGGDTKYPEIRHLLMPFLYLKILMICAKWGIGVIGVFAAGYLLARRKVFAVEFALIVANGVMLLISMRYSSHAGRGSHYHILSAFLGAWFVAHSISLLITTHKSQMFRQLLAGFILLVVTVQYSYIIVRNRPPTYAASQMHLGRQLAALTEPNDLIIVRSTDSIEDTFWNRRNNYEEPTIMYVADLRGWVIPGDKDSLEMIKNATQNGAVYYAEPGICLEYPNVDKWLDGHGEVVLDDNLGRIFRLKSSR